MHANFTITKMNVASINIPSIQILMHIKIYGGFSILLFRRELELLRRENANLKMQLQNKDLFDRNNSLNIN